MKIEIKSPRGLGIDTAVSRIVFVAEDQTDSDLLVKLGAFVIGVSEGSSISTAVAKLLSAPTTDAIRHSPEA